MKRILALLLLLPVTACAATGAIQVKDFGGMQDVIAADKMNHKYATDCQNVILDEYRGSIVKRRGFTKYNTTALTGGQSIKKQFVYKQQDGDEYIIVHSSNSIFYSLNGSGSFSILTSTITTYTYSFTTGRDYLIGSNGTDNPLAWNGTTLIHYTTNNSTGMVKGKYIVYWNNRLFIAGVSSYLSTLYYSEANNPQHIGTFNYININVADGDYITGLLVWNNRLIVFKRFSTWEVQEVSAGVFVIRLLSQEIGCLYGDSIAEVRGFPMWVSHRGVELYDGNFNLVSEPIDNQIKALKQLNIGVEAWTQTTAADWGAGTGTNIDTTTYDGSVGIKSKIEKNQSQDEYYYIVTPVSTGTVVIRQSFMVSKNIYISTITFGMGSMKSAYQYVPFDITCNISTSPIGGVISSVTISAINMPDNTNWPLKYTTFDFSNTNSLLSPGNTYYMIFTTTGTAYMQSFDGKDYYGPFLSFGTSHYDTAYGSGTLTHTYIWDQSGIDLIFSIYGQTILSASYTAQALNAGTSFGSWSNFSVDETSQQNDAVSYYAITATTTYNLTTNTPFPVTNGTPINSSVGPYIIIGSSLIRTSASVVPKINSLTVAWNTGASVPMVATQYKDRYYLSCMGANATYNDTVYVFDRDRNWIRYTGWNMGASCMYKNKLYTGDSSGNGYIYLQDVANLFTDNGSAFTAYWQSKAFDCDTIMNEKVFTDIWVSAKNTDLSSTLSIDYRLDGESDDFSTVSIDLYQTWGYRVQRIPLAFATKGYYIQIKIRSETATDMHVKEVTIPYDIQPAR